MFYSPFIFTRMFGQGRLTMLFGQSPLVTSFSPLLLDPRPVVCSRSLVIRHLVWFHICVEKMASQVHNLISGIPNALLSPLIKEQVPSYSGYSTN